MTYIVVACGESNSGGYVNNAFATAGELASRSEVKMWVPAGTDTFQDLDIGTNNNVSHFGLTSSTHGWELQLANDVAAGVWSQNPMYYVQTGQGGSTLAQWGAVGAYWTEWLDRINKVKAYCTANSITPEWIVWVSIGINDAIAGTPTGTVQSSLITWINLIKAELPSCKIVITELTPSYPTYTAAIRAVADSETDVSFAYTQDLGLGDPNHWNYAGMKSLSTRMTQVSQIQLGVLDGKIYSNYSANMYPNGRSFGWNSTSPSNSGAISKYPISFADGSFVRWLTPASGVTDAVVVALEPTKNTNHTWGAAITYVAAAYRVGSIIYAAIATNNAINAGASNDETRLYRSGNDCLVQTRPTGGAWATKYTATGVLTGITSIHIHIINAAAGVTDALTIYSQVIPSITVTAPTLSQIKLVGTSTNITWSSLDVTGNVDILLSTDGGSTFPTTIASSVSNNGTYAWTPLAANISATAKVRVRSTNAPEYYGESATFNVATTSASGGSNTDLWFRLQELAISDGLELSRP